MKSSPSIWHLLHNVKSTVKISSIFVAFLEEEIDLLVSIKRGIHAPCSYEKDDVVKFVFSKKATKIDEIFTVDLTVWSKCQTNS